MKTGGVCSTLDLIEAITNWVSDKKRILPVLLPRILPDVPKEALGNIDAIKKFYFDFYLMRINHKVARLGKDMKSFFISMDLDKNGLLEPREILIGLTEKYHVYFDLEQTDSLIVYLDADKSGDVSYDEFIAKINYANYNNTFHNYLTTYQTFLEVILDVWEEEKRYDHAHFMSKFYEFDENKDGVLVFEEFEALITNFQKNMAKDDIATLFNETLEMDENAVDMDKMNPECFCRMAYEHKLGGHGKAFLVGNHTEHMKRRSILLGVDTDK